MIDNKKVAIGNDRKGLSYKNELVTWLHTKGYEVIDTGTNEDIPCDYPIYAEKVANLVSQHICQFGILICATGVGISIAANKVNGIRCGIGYNDEVTSLMRQHNDANTIAFGQSFMDIEDIKRRVDIFLNTDFLGSYHLERVLLVEQLEEKN